MGDLAAQREKATMFGKKAYEADQAQDYQTAFDHYYNACKVFGHMIKFEKNPRLIDIYKEKMTEYMERAEQIKKSLNEAKGATDGGNQGGTAAAVKPKTNEEDKNNEENKKMEDALGGAIVKEKPNVKWEDVAGLEQAKASLQEAVLLPIKFPQLFTGERKPWRGILLYGPPGTGKSYLAKACATEVDSTFFSVSSADLVSKWLGESERLVKTLFTMAREHKPSIIFIDEVDSLCGSRSEGQNETSKRVLTEFLVQMNGVGNDQDGVLVLGATNCPWELDSAIRRRFEKRIYIPLPDPVARKVQFQIRLGKTPHSCGEEDFDMLAENSEGYSGSDITVVVKEAMMMPVRRCRTATRFKNLPDGMITPTYPTDPEGFDSNLYNIDNKKLKAPDVTPDDVMAALSMIKPSVGEADLTRQIEFTNEFGQDG